MNPNPLRSIFPWINNLTAALLVGLVALACTDPTFPPPRQRPAANNASSKVLTERDKEAIRYLDGDFTFAETEARKQAAGVMRGFDQVDGAVRSIREVITVNLPTQPLAADDGASYEKLEPAPELYIYNFSPSGFALISADERSMGLIAFSGRGELAYSKENWFNDTPSPFHRLMLFGALNEIFADREKFAQEREALLASADFPPIIQKLDSLHLLQPRPTSLPGARMGDDWVFLSNRERIELGNMDIVKELRSGGFGGSSGSGSGGSSGSGSGGSGFSGSGSGGFGGSSGSGSGGSGFSGSGSGGFGGSGSSGLSIAKPTPKEAAILAAHVHGDKKDAILTGAGGWQVSKTDLGLTKADLDHSPTGLKSEVYERVVNGKVKEYAYVIAGTDITSWKDIKADVAQPFGLSSQYRKAAENAKELSKNVKNSELTFVGYSLGGGEAALNALVTDRAAITFNAAGVSPITKFVEGTWKTPFKSENKIDAYIMLTDPVNFAQDATPFSPNVNGNRHYLTPTSASSVYNGHSMNNLLKEFGVDHERYNRDREKME